LQLALRRRSLLGWNRILYVDALGALPTRQIGVDSLSALGAAEDIGVRAINVRNAECEHERGHE
jgi:hypothetical protein